MRRTAVVLGATGELGSSVARRVLGLSSTLLVHGPDRTETELLAAELNRLDDHCRVVPVPADFTRLESVRELVRRCVEVGELDILVNTVDLLPPKSRLVTEDGNEITWQVNYLGPALASLGLLPLLRQSPVGRIVQVVRDQHRVGIPRTNEPAAGRRYYPAWSYTEAKLALMMLSQTVAGKLRGSGARSAAMQPAGVDVGAAQAPLSRGLIVDAVLYACTSPAVPNGAYLRGRRVHPLPRAAAGVATQQRMWRTTCRLLSLDVRTGRPMRPTDPFSEPLPGDSSDLTAR
ncbi:MAG TPA: SDR family NAD(P)-dependent oxidoreductase [Pseudonocardiaceae bacterium]|nr:SDR family NAD(P)-dependent oxidoreductase [Pseudonocardiaceae bacterium]